MDYIKIGLNAPAKYDEKGNKFVAYLNDNKKYTEIALYRFNMVYEFDNIFDERTQFSYHYVSPIANVRGNVSIAEGYYKDDMGSLTMAINSAIISDMVNHGPLPTDWTPVKLEFDLTTFKVHLTLGGYLIFTMSGSLAKYLGFKSTRFTNVFSTTLTIYADYKFISPELLSVTCDWIPNQVSNIKELPSILNTDVRLLEKNDKIDFKTENPIWFPVAEQEYDTMEIGFYINDKSVPVTGPVVLEFLVRTI